MGAGASNISTSDLSVFQSAISEVSQNISNEASNVSNMEFNIEQVIKFQNGSDAILPQENNPCNMRELSALDCELKCNPSITSHIVSTNGVRNDVNCDNKYGKLNVDFIGDENECDYNYDQPDSLKVCNKQFIRSKCELQEQYDNLDACRGDIKKYKQIINNNKIKFVDEETYKTNYSKLPRCNINSSEDCYYTDVSLSNQFYCLKMPTLQTTEECKSSCSKIRCSEDLAYKYQELMTRGGVIEGYDINITNDLDNTVNNTQVASVDTSVQLISKITNQFDNEITKEITQKNTGINFGQYNSSQERTDITQKTLNTVKQAVNSAAKNVSYTKADGKQIIEFINYGVIKADSKCSNEPVKDSSGNIIQPANIIKSSNGEENPCLYASNGKIEITNKAVNNMSNDQTSKSILSALMDSSILNEMKNKYTLKVSQTNAGLDLTMIFLLIFLIILAFLFGGLVILFILKKFIYTGLDVVQKSAEVGAEVGKKGAGLLGNKWVVIALVITGICVVIAGSIGGYVAAKNDKNNDENISISNLTDETSNIKKNVNCSSIKKYNYISITASGNTEEICKNVSEIFDFPDSIRNMDDAKKYIQNKLNEKYPGKFPLLFEYYDDEVVVRSDDVLGFSFIIKKN